MRSRSALLVVVALLAGCSDDGFEGARNNTLREEQVLEFADTVVFAETVSVDESGDHDAATVTIRVVATFAGELAVGDDNRYTFDYGGPMSGAVNGFWLFDSAGRPVESPEPDWEIHRLPWPQDSRYAVFERFPLGVGAADLLDSADIVVMGAVPRGTFSTGDATMTIDVEHLLKGDPGPSRHLVVDVGGVVTNDPGIQRHCVFLIDETADGDLVLHDTWVEMPWGWDEPALGDALQAAFPDVTPPDPDDC